MAEPFARAFLNLAEGFFGGGNSLRNVFSLRRQEYEALFSFRKFFQRHHVYRAEILETIAQVLEPCALRIEIEFRRQRHLARKIFQILIQLVRARFAHKV